MRAGTNHEVVELGQFTPRRRPCASLSAGQVGYLICNIKSLDQVHIGDTICHAGDTSVAPLPGYEVPRGRPHEIRRSVPL